MARIPTIAALIMSILLVGIFACCCQVAFVKGVSETIHGPNGITGTITAPSGSKISNFTISQDLGPSVSLDNSTWKIYNATSGSVGIITFKDHIQWYPHQGGIPRDTYMRVLNGHIHKGTADGLGPLELDTYLILCPEHRGETVKCSYLLPTKISANYIEFANEVSRVGVAPWPPQQIPWSISLTRIDVHNYQAGYQYGDNEYNRYITSSHHFECPLSHIAPTSNFCKGYDAALMYENSDQ